VRFLSCKSLKNRDKNMVVGLCSVSHGNRTLWGEVVMIVVGIRGLATRSNVTNLPTLTLPLLLLTLLACPFSQIQKKHPPHCFSSLASKYSFPLLHKKKTKYKNLVEVDAIGFGSGRVFEFQLRTIRPLRLRYVYDNITKKKNTCLNLNLAEFPNINLKGL
jgi:hypothetical protein